MQVAETLLVLLDAELEGAGLESFVAEVLEGRCDDDDVAALPLFAAGLLVFGKVLVGVAGFVGDLLGGLVVVVAGELTAV